MPEYTEENTLRIAKRFQNQKRPYLLVNPLQAKHMPVAPSRALGMMDTLGEKLARKYPGARLVIGFAETATAIGAAAACRLGPDCVYLHTTREDFPRAEGWIEFREEHSHAVEQKLRGDGLGEYLAGTDTVILVDDEISTGRTLINMVRELGAQYPVLREKTVVAASVLNRVSPENQALLEQAGIESEWLVKLPQEDYAALVEGLEVRQADRAEPRRLSFRRRTLDCGPLGDPRLGLTAGEYQRSCADMARAFLRRMGEDLRPGGRVLVLGTEECMYPALVLGRALEGAGRGWSVRCHATTRSPIGICGAPGYPIPTGSRVASFYEAERTTYVYNTAPCDGVIVVSDTPVGGTEALCSLLGAIPLAADTQVFYVQGGQDVWYL